MKRKSLKVSVKQGIIEVNSALVLIETKDLIWISMDTTQKYPKVKDLWMTGDAEHALLIAGPRTPFANKKLPPTEVSVNLRDPAGGRWAEFSQTGRYTVNLVYVRRPTKHGRFIMHTVGTLR